MSYALSLRQPWAWLVIHGRKRIENRRWNTNRRGPILIHAAKGMTADEYAAAAHFASIVAPGLSLSIPQPKVIERGGIVGRAHVVDVLPPCQDDSLFFRPCEHPWHMPGQYGFVLADVEPLPFRPVRGELGFFHVDEADRTTSATGGGEK